MTEKTGAPEAPQSHPKLEMAASEIEALLLKYDIAGLVVLHTIGFKKVICKIDPSYSVCEVDDFKRLKIIKPIIDSEAPGAAEKHVADTVNMLSHLQFSASQLAQVLTQAVVGVKMAFGIMPKPTPPTPPNFINGKKRR